VRPSLRLSVFALVLAVAPLTARAEADKSRRIEELERRVEELESQHDKGAGEASRSDEEPSDETETFEDRYGSAALLQDWLKRVQLGGSANTGYYWGESDSVLHTRSFAVWDARFFVDAELGEDVLLGDSLVLRNAGFTFEWDLVRVGGLDNAVGELYAEFQGVLGSPWANLQVGRFQVPVGEAYLRYSKGYADKPFITNSYGPWFWDEGLKLYGSDIESRFGYVASVSDGDTSFANEGDSDKQVTLKLFANPTRWLHVSVSGARTGRLGSASSPAASALWLGESWARAFGSGSAVPNFVNGVVVPDGPNVIRDGYFLGGDAVFKRSRWGQLWLAYGAFWIDSNRDAGLYDRTLQYWIAELQLEGRLAHPVLEPFYLGLRVQGLGTYDHDRGYLLDSRYAGTLGYNMESQTSYSAVVGWRLTRWLRLRAEYSHVDIGLVRGVPRSIRSAADAADSAAIEVGVHF
jgi:hypothetical protein